MVIFCIGFNVCSSCFDLLCNTCSIREKRAGDWQCVLLQAGTLSQILAGQTTAESDVDMLAWLDWILPEDSWGI